VYFAFLKRIRFDFYLYIYIFANQFRTMADNKATKEEVEAFLNEFKEKAKVFGIVYHEGKGENRQTLFDLELFGSKRDQYILNLRPEDYYQG